MLLTKADIVSDLERRVLGGEFEGDNRLPSSRNLCDEYGVSRPVIREALAGLVERGLIVVSPGRGAFVREASMDQLSEPLIRAANRAGATARQLVAARTMLESTAAELAAGHPRGADEARASIGSALREHQEAETLADRADTDLAFHEAIVAASANPLIGLMFAAIRGHVRTLMLRSHSDRRVRRLGVPWHETIADAIVSGDPAAARSAMREHLELALTLYGDDLDRPLAEIVARRGIEV
jgi:DNA-binding FadR family transcriptional regulator